MLEKLKNKEPIKEPDLTTKPVAESQQGITPSPRKLIHKRVFHPKKGIFKSKLWLAFSKIVSLMNKFVSLNCLIACLCLICIPVNTKSDFKRHSMVNHLGDP